MINVLKIVLISILVFILVIVIMSIFFTFFDVEFLTYGSKERVTKNQIFATEILLNGYYEDVGHYPSTAQGLKVFFVKPDGPDGFKWKGPYTKFKRLPIDAWGNDLQYQCPGIHNPKSFDLWSNGADRKRGGKNKNVDIGNW
jgi:general secretion pathway protein G